MKSICILLLFTGFFYSCAPVSKKSLHKSFRLTDERFKDHTGFVLYDLDRNKTVYEYQAANYFTPASNTKIFTLFSCLTILSDSIPALKYVETEDSLIFWGTGDPSFLYKEVYDNSRVYSFLQSATVPLYFSNGNFSTTHFGPGWAWDDYNDYYSPERSPFPIYGNMISVHSFGNKVTVYPSYFKNYVQQDSDAKKSKVIRRLENNEFTFYAGPQQKEFEANVPFKVNPELTSNLLADTLDKMVRHIEQPFRKNAKTLYSVPVDSLYKLMMQESDNFIAEQLLLVCSQAVSDTLQPDIAIRYIKENFLRDLVDEPQWVDGSGLSRYNLFTPRTIVEVWKKIYRLIPRDRLFAILATGGRSGTIKNWYKGDQPYIFGKTGSLSNNHCLSGYLVAKSGRTFIFSFMNNNFASPVNEIKINMENILKSIYENY
jgi:serine-type D-Ala-D-Ala carboxypeptidase/endopeptidase (penicillin-binding protein 4)